MRRFLTCVGLLVLLALPASAIPATFNFVSGYAVVTAEKAVSLQQIVAPTLLALDGTYVTFDTAPIDLTDFEFTLPQSAVINMTNPYGGYDSFRVESASLQPGTPYSTLNGQMTGPNTFTFVAGFIDINGVYSAWDNNPALPNPPPTLNAAVPFQDNSFVSGTVDTVSLTLEMTGITFAVLPGFFFGESEDLRVKGDIFFFGLNPIPEPSTGALVGLGLAGLVLRRRSALKSSRQVC